MKPELPLLTPGWPAPVNVRAAMTTRIGGVSSGPFTSLNMGLSGGDDSAAVSENRRRVYAALDMPGEPGWIRQVHGAQAVRMPHPVAEPAADASWTCDRAVVCVVQAADCLPVLFCDDKGTVVAAAHAGWRGLATGVLEATVRALPVEPHLLMAWMGAAIGPESFEVGSEVREAFVNRDALTGSCFVPAAEPGKFMADLYGLARRRLTMAGVTRVYGGGRCTFREAGHFFSYRRDGQCGRMAALIWLL